jgi:glycosyltransferase involved in cell wall biosynthesis
VAIAHGNVVAHDAIGTDILGMHDVLSECGFEVSLIAEHFDAAARKRARTVETQAAMKAESPDVLIYHHSIFWERGEKLFGATQATRVLKYHNVTPPEFYEDYSPRYVALCGAGRRQTARLVAMMGEGDLMTADSEYNAAELAALGASSPRVVPPFTQVAHFVSRPPAAAPKPPYSLLFVGRMAPHKGHFDLLTLVAAYVAAFGPGIRLTMIGGLDEQLEDYAADLRHQIKALGVEQLVEIVNKGVDDERLRQIFAEASAFVCMSEHEGFCVPIIEAQASGVPLISVGATALGETVGTGQLVVDPPRTKLDYASIARLIHGVCTDPALRSQVIAAGYRNVLTRFSHNAVADRFMGSLTPVLERLA